MVAQLSQLRRTILAKMCYHARMALDTLHYTDSVPKSQTDRRSVQVAAREVGLSEATVWRYLERGLLRRYHTTVGKRRTLVEMAELRQLVENPPSEPAN